MRRTLGPLPLTLDGLFIASPRARARGVSYPVMRAYRKRSHIAGNAAPIGNQTAQLAGDVISVASFVSVLARPPDVWSWSNTGIAWFRAFLSARRVHCW